LNNIVEQDHRFIKKRIAAALWFRSVSGAEVPALSIDGRDTV
jgi:transposase-like protein